MKTIKHWFAVLLSIFKPKIQQEIQYLVFYHGVDKDGQIRGSVNVARTLPITSPEDFNTLYDDVLAYKQTENTGLIGLSITNMIRLPY